MAIYEFNKERMVKLDEASFAQEKIMGGINGVRYF